MSIIIILLILISILFWPWIKRWIAQLIARRTEDMIRKMAGMPSRKEEEKMQRNKKKSQNNPYYSQHKPQNSQTPHQAMQQYAEDIEFTEFKNFSSSTVIDEDPYKTQTWNETQITDVEFTEIKTKN